MMLVVSEVKLDLNHLLPSVREEGVWVCSTRGVPSARAAEEKQALNESFTKQTSFCLNYTVLFYLDPQPKGTHCNTLSHTR